MVADALISFMSGYVASNTISSTLQLYKMRRDMITMWDVCRDFNAIQYHLHKALIISSNLKKATELERNGVESKLISKIGCRVVTPNLMCAGCLEQSIKAKETFLKGQMGEDSRHPIISTEGWRLLSWFLSKFNVWYRRLMEMDAYKNRVTNYSIICLLSDMVSRCGQIALKMYSKMSSEMTREYRKRVITRHLIRNQQYTTISYILFGNVLSRDRAKVRKYPCHYLTTKNKGVTE